MIERENKMTASASVGITLGKNLELIITYDNDLMIIDRKTGRSMDLGKATVKRFNDLQSFLRRLSIHAIP